MTNFYRDERSRRNMTQEDIAFAAGIAASAVSRVENGVRRYNHKLDLWLIETSENPAEMARFLRECHEKD